jgi:uncharacterized protein YoxC
MIKKFIALFALGLLLVSVFSGVAEARINGLNAVSIRDFPHLQGIGKYQEIKSNSQDLTREWVTVRNEWMAVKSKADLDGTSGTGGGNQPVGGTGGGNQPVDMGSKEIIEKFREFLELTIDRINVRLELLAYWVDRVVKDEEKKEELLDLIDKRIAKFEELRSSIEEATTMNELRDLGKEIRQEWIKTKNYIRRTVAIILSHRINAVLDRLEKVSERLHEKIDSLDQSSREVEDMQTLLEQFDEHIKLAREEYDKYREIQEEMEAGDINSIEQSREYLRNAREHIKEALKVLRELIKSYREYNRAQEVPNKPLYLDLDNSASGENGN